MATILEIIETKRVKYLIDKREFWKNHVGEIRTSKENYADMLCDDVDDLALLETDFSENWLVV